MLQEPKGRPDLLIIAGEHSGDQHAAVLLKKLLILRPDLKVCALGGKELQASGAQLLWDMTESSVVGLFEVLKNYPFFKKLFDQTISWIKTYQPRTICFVDYPGFNLRVAKKLFEEGLCHKGGGGINLCYYIGPQIWAWKAKRRFEMAKCLDTLGVIFPFEVDCYKDTELNVHFVGHPFLLPEFISPVIYDEHGPILLLPGSRKAAVGRIFPIMLDAFELFLKDFPNEIALVVYPTERIKKVLERCLKGRTRLEGKIKLCDTSKLVSGKAVLGSSGTMSLACALAGIPGAVLYRANPLTYFIGKMIVDIDKLGMANILLGEQVYPEYLQSKAKAEVLRDELVECLSSNKSREKIILHAQKLKNLLEHESNLGPAEWISPWIL
jgi:lipid-A-disaccharide synthase